MLVQRVKDMNLRSHWISVMSTPRIKLVKVKKGKERSWMNQPQTLESLRLTLLLRSTSKAFRLKSAAEELKLEERLKSASETSKDRSLLRS